MEQKKWWQQPVQKKYIPWYLIGLGIFLRFIALGVAPGGLNQDEAFAGYESFSMLNYGTDSFGYVRPVYFIAWGSGMNVLYSYLTIPFLFLFGKHLWVIRLVQAICGSLSLLAFYDIMKRLFPGRLSGIALGLLTICPWHIMLSRWGLESNIAPAFLLFAMWAGLRATEKDIYYFWMFLFYGLSLYTYATIWILVPFLILYQILYFRRKGLFHWNAWFIAGGLLFLAFAVPLLLFIFVNAGWMDEIVTPFFSVPKLLYFRKSELGIHNIFSNLYDLYCVLVNQYDGVASNYADQFGLYYKWTLPLQLIGLYRLGRIAFGRGKQDNRKNADDEKNPGQQKKCILTGESYFLLYGILCFLLGCTFSVNINRINCIHIFMVLLLAEGIEFLLETFKPWVAKCVGIALIISFIGFLGFYFSDYCEIFNDNYYDGIEEAVDYAMAKGKTICVNDNISYSLIMYCSEISPEEYRKTVRYTEYPAAVLQVAAFGNFKFGYDINAISYDKVYIIDDYEIADFEEKGFAVEAFGNCAVAYIAPLH